LPIQEFLNSLLVGSALLPAVVENMENLYKLSESCNMEILFSWIRVGIAARSVIQTFRGSYFFRVPEYFVSYNSHLLLYKQKYIELT